MLSTVWGGRTTGAVGTWGQSVWCGDGCVGGERVQGAYADVEAGVEVFWWSQGGAGSTMSAFGER